jgi:hypothetical protein
LERHRARRFIRARNREAYAPNQRSRLRESIRFRRDAIVPLEMAMQDVMRITRRIDDVLGI